LGSTTFDLSYVTGKIAYITTRGNATLSLRGEWVDIGTNGTLLQLTAGTSNTTRDLTLNVSSIRFRDLADNFATNKSQTAVSATSMNGPKAVVADYGFVAPNNTAVTVAFPTCVNTGNMSAFLPSTTTQFSFVSYFNTATWTDTSVANLRQLPGYRFTWSDTGRFPSQDGGDNVFRVYLANQSDCAIESGEITVGNGWNYLAMNGNYYHNPRNLLGRLKDTPDNWLDSLSSSGTIEVSQITPGFGNTTAYKNGGGAGFNNWDTLKVGPFTDALWVVSSNTNSRSFVGTGRN